VRRCSPCWTAPKGPDLAGTRRRDSCAHLTEHGATTIWEAALGVIFLSMPPGSFAIRRPRTRPSRWAKRLTVSRDPGPLQQLRGAARAVGRRCARARGRWVARAMGWIGFNCSIPTRSRRSTILDGLGESAALIGAVNCFVRRREKAIGENTEGRGFVTALRSFVDPSGCKIACNNDPLRGGFRVQ
jgi:hypothetical protein